MNFLHEGFDASKNIIVVHKKTKTTSTLMKRVQVTELQM